MSSAEDVEGRSVGLEDTVNDMIGPRFVVCTHPTSDSTELRLPATTLELIPPGYHPGGMSSVPPFR